MSFQIARDLLKLDRDEARTVDLFTLAMLEELSANSRKGGWKDTPVDVMVDSLVYHIAKLVVAVRMGVPAAVREYAADVGNEAMMVADIVGVLGVVSSGNPMLLQDVMIGPAVDGVQRAWADNESQEASQVSGELMDAAKEFVRAIGDLATPDKLELKPKPTS